MNSQNKLNMMPFERYEKFGVESLSDKDLLAVILRTGSSKSNVFETVDKIFELESVKQKGICGLSFLTKQELLSIEGIGKVKEAILSSIIELSKRMRREGAKEKLSFKSPSSIADYYMDRMRFLDREHVIIVYLNSKNEMICDEVISIGASNFSVVSPRDIFTRALKHEAFSLIMLHNHPSGDPTPSNCDYETTRIMSESSKLLMMPFLDHLIIGNNRYFSMAENGFLGGNS